MNEARRSLRYIFLSMMFFLLLGCATPTPPYAPKTQALLNSYMGRLTYEQALQSYGPPTQCSESGNVKSCVWVYGSPGSVQIPMTDLGGTTVLTAPINPPSMMLSFTNNVLSNWRISGKWP